MSGTIFPPPPPCRICGEDREIELWLDFDVVVVHAADGSLERDPDGSVKHATVDGFSCCMCGTTMTVDVWNGRLPSDAERAAYREYCAAIEAGTEKRAVFA